MHKVETQWGIQNYEQFDTFDHTKFIIRQKRDVNNSTNNNSNTRRRVVKKLVSVRLRSSTTERNDTTPKRRRKVVKIKKKKRPINRNLETTAEPSKRRRKVIITRKRLLSKPPETITDNFYTIPTEALEATEISATNVVEQMLDKTLPHEESINLIPEDIEQNSDEDTTEHVEDPEQFDEIDDLGEDDYIEKEEPKSKDEDPVATRLEISPTKSVDQMQENTLPQKDSINIIPEDIEQSSEEDTTEHVEDLEQFDEMGDLGEDEYKDKEDPESKDEDHGPTRLEIDIDNESLYEDDIYGSLDKVKELKEKTEENEDARNSNYDVLFPELSESFDSPSILLKTTILTSTEYETITSLQSKNKTYTLVVTRVNGDEQIVTSSTEVLPHTKTVIVTEPVLRYTTLTLLDLDTRDTLPLIPNSATPANDTQEEGRGLDEARYNLATRVMSNGVEVIVAGDKSTLPGEPDVSRILPSSIYKPVTLKPSTLSDHMMMIGPKSSEGSILPTSTYPNQFVTKTCLTTFTYLTTYVENGTTTVSSHEQVVSNVATEERNTGKILPTPTMGITLTQFPNLSVGIFPTTYTYLNTIMDGEQPLIVQSKHTVTNTVTAPDDYLSLLQPQEKASAVKETNTYYTTVTAKKTLEDNSATNDISSEEVLTQVVITESVPPKATSVMTSYIALDVEDPPSKNDITTTDVLKTYYITYSYFNTIMQNGNSYVQTNISISSDVVTEKLYLHPKRTSSTNSANTDNKDLKKKHKFETENFDIYATKTYLTTFTTTTTLLEEGGDKSDTKLISQSRVVENIVTESIEPTLLDKKFLNSIKKEIKDTNTLTKAATVNGEKIEVTIIAKPKIKPTSVLPIEKTQMPEISSSETIQPSSPNVITGSTIVFVDEDDDPFKLAASEPTPVLTSAKIAKTTTLTNNLNSLLSSEIVNKSSKNSKRHTNKETLSPSRPTITSSSKVNKDNKKKPAKINRPADQVSDWGLGQLNINRLTPVLNVMADLIQNNLKATKRNDTVVTHKHEKHHYKEEIVAKTPIRQPIGNDKNRPIYIPVGGFTDIELAESQNIANFDFNEQIPWQDSKQKINESPLINGGIPISPGEIITANSDVIVGRPGLVRPRIPAIPVRDINDVPIDMKPPPEQFQHAESNHVPIRHPDYPTKHPEHLRHREPARYPEHPVHPIIHVPNKDDYVGPPPPPSFQKRVPLKPEKPIHPMVHAPNKDDYVGPPPPLKVHPNKNEYIPLVAPPVNQGDQFYQVNEQVLVGNAQDSTPNESIIRNQNIQPAVVLGTPLNDISPSIISRPLGLPEVIERSTGQPLLVNIQPSQVAFVNIPHNRTTALIYGGSTEPHKSGQYFDDPSPYAEPEFSGIESFNNGVPQFASIYNQQLDRGQQQVSGVIKVDPHPVNQSPSANIANKVVIRPSKPGDFVNNVYFDSNMNNKDVKINAPPISFGAIQKDNEFDGYIIRHEIPSPKLPLEKHNQIRFPNDRPNTNFAVVHSGDISNNAYYENKFENNQNQGHVVSDQFGAQHNENALKQQEKQQQQQGHIYNVQYNNFHNKQHTDQGHGFSGQSSAHHNENVLKQQEQQKEQQNINYYVQNSNFHNKHVDQGHVFHNENVLKQQEQQKEQQDLLYYAQNSNFYNKQQHVDPPNIFSTSNFNSQHENLNNFRPPVDRPNFARPPDSINIQNLQQHLVTQDLHHENNNPPNIHKKPNVINVDQNNFEKEQYGHANQNNAGTRPSFSNEQYGHSNQNIETTRPGLPKEHYGRPQANFNFKRPRPNIRPNHRPQRPRPKPDIPSYMIPPPVTSHDTFDKNIFNQFSIPNKYESTPSSTPISVLPAGKDSYKINVVDSNNDDFDDDHGGDINDAGEVIQESNTRPLRLGQVPIEILKAKISTTTQSPPVNKNIAKSNRTNDVLIQRPQLVMPVVRPENHQGNQIMFHEFDDSNLHTQPGSGTVYIRTNLSVTHKNPMDVGVYIHTTTLRPRLTTRRHHTTTGYILNSHAPTTQRPVTHFVEHRRNFTKRPAHNKHQRPPVTSLPIDTRFSTHRPLLHVEPLEINSLGTQTEEPYNPVYTKTPQDTTNFIFSKSEPISTNKYTTTTIGSTIPVRTTRRPTSRTTTSRPTTARPTTSRSTTPSPTPVRTTVNEVWKEGDLNEGEVPPTIIKDNQTVDLEVLKPPPRHIIEAPDTEMHPPRIEINSPSGEIYRVPNLSSPKPVDLDFSSSTVKPYVPKPSEEMVPPPITTEEVVGMSPPPITTHRPLYKFKVTTNKPYFDVDGKITTNKPLRTRRPHTRRPVVYKTTETTRNPAYNWQSNVVFVRNSTETPTTTTERVIDSWTFNKFESNNPNIKKNITDVIVREVTTKHYTETTKYKTTTEKRKTTTEEPILDSAEEENVNVEIINQNHTKLTEASKIVPSKSVHISPSHTRVSSDTSKVTPTSKVDILSTYVENTIHNIKDIEIESSMNPSFDKTQLPTKSLEQTPSVTFSGQTESVINSSPTTSMTEFTHYGTYNPSDDRRTRIAPTRRPVKTVINKIISIRPVSTKHVTHTIVTTVTVTETKVIHTSGGPPSTMTTLITKTETTTKVEVSTLLKPTSITRTETRTTTINQFPATLYPPGVKYGQIYPSVVAPSLSTTIYEEDVDNGDQFIITQTDPHQDEEFEHENDSIMIVLTDKNKGSILHEDETPTRDEMLETNNVDQIQVGGFLVPHLPSLEIPNLQRDKCNPECRASKNELCQKVEGLMRCVCRPGFARMFPDHPCKPTYTYTLNLGLDRIGKEHLKYKGTLANHNSTDYLRLASLTQEGLHRMVMQTDLRDIYHGVSINGFETDVKGTLVNNFNLQLSDNTDETRLMDNFKRYLRNNNYNLGGTDLYASREGLERLQAEDFNECSNRIYHDCSEFAHCFNLRGTYTCSCKEGFADLSVNILYPGRICSAELIGCDECNYHGTCYDRGEDKVICECFQWYAGEHCQINLKVLLIGLVTLGTILLALLLVCVILTCCRRKPKASSVATGMSFLPQRVQNRRSTLDRRAMIQDTSSESGQSENNTLPYVPKKPKKLKGALKKPKPRNDTSDVDHQHTLTMPDQKDRSLTVMIPRAKYHPAPPTSPHITLTTFDKRKTSAASSNEAKLLSYLDAGPAPDKTNHQRKYSTAHSESYIEEKPVTRKSSGALISAGFEVSATVVGNNMGTLGTIATTCGTEADRSENATLIQKISADLLSDTDTRSQFNTLRNAILDDVIEDPMANWMDTRITTVSEARSYDETTIHPPMKSFRNYDSKPSSQHHNDEANTMAERDLGSTFLLPHTHLYKPGGGSDISGFESL